MKSKHFYLRFKQPLYVKMFCTYSAIIICIVTVLTLYFISDSKKRLLESNRELVERTGRQAFDYIEETGRAADYIYRDLYRSSLELNDLLEYLRREPEEYVEYSLQQYSASADLVYKGIFLFFNEAFEAYQQLEKIEVISYQTSRMTEYYPEKMVYPGKDGRPRMKQIQNNHYSKRGKLVYLKEIRHPDTMRPVGCILFEFEAADTFESIRDDSPYTHMAVISGEDEVIFQRPKGEDYRRLIRQDQYIVSTESVRGFQVHTFMEERQASRMSASRMMLFLTVGVVVSAAGMLNIQLYVKRLTRRVEQILEAMNQVTTGDFRVRLTAGSKKDELDMIAENFNDMCGKLETYITKSYLEEIERKNAWMQALQSQINPHFLYNTLEAIRMKAICNGDREVGKMLYSMVVLFRSQLKEADVITLGQELDYCKQYMELFEYRYQNSFHSSVECPAELLSMPVIKFVLQPVIENYFIHGIQRDRQDNLVRVVAQRKDKTLYLYVQDNGCGMDAALLEEKNSQLKENCIPKNNTGSIGIENVNRRIKAAYGDNYGVSIEAVQPCGLRVILRLKAGQPSSLDVRTDDGNIRSAENVSDVVAEEGGIE